jgi:hypothetical protein
MSGTVSDKLEVTWPVVFLIFPMCEDGNLDPAASVRR